MIEDVDDLSESERKQRQAQWVTRLCQGCKRAVVREHIFKVKNDHCKWCQAGVSQLPSTETKGVLSAHHSAKS